jgi:hypothetical protein
LQKLRETGDVAFLDLAFRAARSSLASVPEVRNPGALAASRKPSLPRTNLPPPATTP